MKLALDIVLALVGAILFPQMLSDEGVLFSNSFFSVLLFGGLFALFQVTHWDRFSLRRFVFSHLAGLLFSVMTAFGFALQNLGTVDYGSTKLWNAIVMYAHVYAQLLSVVWVGLEKLEPRLSMAPQNGFFRAMDWVLGRPYIVLPVLLLLWLPCWLATWPGNFIYDATKEFSQLEKGWMGDFPMLHSVIVVKLLEWSFEAHGDYNTGIAIYTGIQMLLLAAMFTHMICRFRSLGGNRWVVLAMTVYCGAFPAVHVLVTAMLRDILFAGLLTYSVFLLWLMCRDVKGFLGSWWKPAGPALVVVLTIYARNNNTGGMLPWILAAVALVLFLVGGKKGWKGALVFGVTALGSYLALGSILGGICDPITPPSANASMTVYTQTLMRAYTLEQESWTPGEKLAMFEFFNTKGLTYTPENGDSTKGRFIATTPEQKQKFMEFWKEMGKRYPAHYADAILLNTRAAWFPGTVMDGYQKRNVGMYQDFDKCWFFYGPVIEEPGVLESKWPELHDWYMNLSMNISYEKIPVVSLLFSVGFHFWLVLACLFWAFYRKARQLYLPLAVLIAYTVISMCVPLMLLRYFAALILAFPLILAFTMQPHVGSIKPAEVISISEKPEELKEETKA